MSLSSAVLVPQVLHPKKRAFLAAYSRCGSISQAAKRAKVDRRTHYNWFREDLAYREAFQQASIEACDALEDRMKELAFDGNVAAGIFMLKSLRPEKYKDHKTIHLDLKDWDGDISRAGRRDRSIHAYIPGWEFQKTRDDVYTNHFGLVTDYLAEVFKEVRKCSYADYVERHFRFGAHLGGRDQKAVRKIVSGLVKLLHPDGEVSQEELQGYLDYTMEMRRRVKEQLKKMGGLEYWDTSFSFVAKDSGEETFVSVPEMGGGTLIAEGNLPLGSLYTIGTDLGDRRLALFLLQAQMNPGSGRIIPLGNLSTKMKEAIILCTSNPAILYGIEFLPAGAESVLRITLTRVTGYRRPPWEITTPTYSLNQTRSGSDRCTASTSLGSRSHHPEPLPS